MGAGLRIDGRPGVGTLGFSADGMGGLADGSRTVTISPIGSPIGTATGDGRVAA